MYVYGLCLLFDFATKNLHFATTFYHLVDKCDLRILLILSPEDAPYLIIKIKQMFLSFPECLVQQASFGSTPSTLILSYLNHGITTKVWYKSITQTL